MPLTNYGADLKKGVLYRFEIHGLINGNFWYGGRFMMEVEDTSATNEVIVSSPMEFYFLDEFRWWEEEGMTAENASSSSVLGTVDIYTSTLNFNH